MKNKSVLKISIVSAIAVLVILFGVFINYYTEYMELLEIGKNFTEIFWRNLSLSFISFGIIFVLSFAAFYVTFTVIRKNLLAIDSSFSYLKKTFPAVIIITIISAFFAYNGKNEISETFLPFLTSKWFGLGDPLFHQDVGYYVFQRPFYISIVNLLYSFSISLIILTAAAYFICFAFFDFYNMKSLLKEKNICIHEIINIIFLFAIQTMFFKFRSEEILFQTNSGITGGNFIDIKLWIPFYTIAPFFLIALIAITLFFVFKKKFVHAIMSAAVYPITMVLLMIAGSIMQMVVVEPNEFAVESKYITHNIDFTRAAYGLDKIEDIDFTVENNLTPEDIVENSSTINNVRLVDFAQTVNVANQIQSIRNYYHFLDTDIVTYDIDGKPTAVMLAARELNTANIEASAKNYINSKMKYTHGTGVVLNPANTVTEQGQPYFMVRDIPVRSIEGAPKIVQPRIYYGESPQKDDYVITGTAGGEIDDISNKYVYSGSAGIGLNFFSRLVYSFKYLDFNLLVSDQINANSKILTNRNVLERVKLTAPFLTFDEDPYILIADDGSLKWIVDGYTTSEWFPYSQYTGEINYIRNSVRAVVDAYNGTVKLYIIDETDPIIESYRQIFPKIFESSEFPKDLAQHIRYPEKIFKIRAEILKKYHIKNAEDFYQNRGVWAFSKEKSTDETPKDIEPYYNLMKVEGSDTEQLVLMIPYTLANKDNMVSWLAVCCSDKEFGRTVCYNFNQNENIYGPYQIENKIDTDPAISRDITLWGQSGSNVIRGNLFVVPVENSIIYVEPLYISSGNEESSLPEVKRIIVVHGEKVVSAETFGEALSKLFNVQITSDAPESNEESVDDVMLRVISSFERVKNASAENNWEEYGAAMNDLDVNINILKQKINGDQEQPAEAEQETAEITEE